MRPTIDNVDRVIRGTWGWWLLAERFCSRITTPAIDVAAADRAVEALLRDSWLWSRGQSLASKVQAAWLDSICLAFVRWLTRPWR
jgi:hypothetical protein